MEITCPNCGIKLELPDNISLDRNLECPSCSHKFQLSNYKNKITKNYMNSKITNYVVIAISLCSLLISTIALTVNLSNPKVISKVKSDVKPDIGRFKFITKDTDTNPSGSIIQIFDTSTGGLCELSILPSSLNGDFIRIVSYNDFNGLKVEADRQRNDRVKEFFKKR